MKLLLATHNKGKAKDLAALLTGFPVEILTLEAFPETPEVEEDQETLIGNARKKAKEIHQATGLPVLADDSGLMVDALDGRPGVKSARYAGEPADDERNRRKLLEELRSFRSAAQRSARFECRLVYFDGRHERTTRGTCEGHISFEPRGDNGFGYDPVFIHGAFGGRTLGEVTREEKNSVSHRGMALRQMREELKRLWADNAGHDG